MRGAQRALCLLLVASASLAALYLHLWAPKGPPSVDLRRPPPERLPPPLPPPARAYPHVPFRLKEEVMELLPRNGCSCEAEAEAGLALPLRRRLFGPSPGGLDFASAFAPGERPRQLRLREREYRNYRNRVQTPADRLLIVPANSPLEYPAQGVEVRPLQTVLVPGLSLQAPARNRYQVNLTASLGTLAVAAEVEGVALRGEGQPHLSLAAAHLDHLNRQLQFVTYTNTQFHPDTADIVQFSTDGHSAAFAIRIRHPPTPRLYGPGTPGDGDSDSDSDSSGDGGSSPTPRVQHLGAGDSGHQDVPALRQTAGAHRQHPPLLPFRHHRGGRRQPAPRAPVRAPPGALPHALRQGLVRREEPGGVAGDNQVRAVGGRRLHLHPPHTAGEAGGRAGENQPGPGGRRGAGDHGLHHHVPAAPERAGRRRGGRLPADPARLPPPPRRLPRLCRHRRRRQLLPGPHRQGAPGGLRPPPAPRGSSRVLHRRAGGAARGLVRGCGGGPRVQAGAAVAALGGRAPVQPVPVPGSAGRQPAPQAAPLLLQEPLQVHGRRLGTATGPGRRPRPPAASPGVPHGR